MGQMNKTGNIIQWMKDDLKENIYVLQWNHK